MPTAKLPLSPKRAQVRFECWRTNRGKQWKIPEELWELAATMGSEHGVSRTCSALRLGYSKLKRFVLEYERRLEAAREHPPVEPSPEPQIDEPADTAPELESDEDAAPELATQSRDVSSTPKAGVTSLERGPVAALPADPDLPDPPTFFELFPAAAGCPPQECQIELEDAYGRKMKVHLKGGGVPDLACLGRLLFSGGSP